MQTNMRTFKTHNISRRASSVVNPHAKHIQVCVCGGGNAGHVFAVLAAARGYKTNVLTLQGTKFRTWRSAHAQSGTRLDFTIDQKSISTNNIHTITNDPAKAIPNSNVFLISVPAHAHGSYLKHIHNFATYPSIISVWPGIGGLDFQFRDIFGTKAAHFGLVSGATLPWGCRIKQYGQSATVMATKDEMGYTSMMSEEFNANWTENHAPVMDILHDITGEQPVFRDDGHMLGSSLGQTNSACHTSLMYGYWALEWDGKGLDAPPLFYQGSSPEAAQVMHDMSSEQLEIGAAVRSKFPHISFDIYHQEEFYRKSYSRICEDTSSLHAMLLTNPTYTGLTHPCVRHPADGLYYPDYSSRFMSEDVPFGLAVFKGIALLVGVETPTVDRVLTWAQGVMGKEYLVDGKLIGKDVVETRAPQAFGFESLEELLAREDVDRGYLLK